MEASQLTVKAQREAVGLSQQALANKAKCSMTTVRNAENGWIPSAQMQRRIARALKTTMEELWPN